MFYIIRSMTDKIRIVLTGEAVSCVAMVAAWWHMNKSLETWLKCRV